MRNTTYSHRTLFSWRDNPLPSRITSQKRERLRLIDSACQYISDLPTMRGMIRQAPSLVDTAIMAVAQKSFDGAAYYNIVKDRTEVNFASECLADGQDTALLPSLISHEFRHAFQGATGCMAFFENKNLQRSGRLYLAFDRVTEGDARVFSIAVCYELRLKGVNAPLASLRRFGPRASVVAYEQAVATDPAAHWNGKAASDALRAYFSRSNANCLESYDLDNVRSLSHEMRGKRRSASLPEAQVVKEFNRHARALDLMPYEGGDGVLRNRFHYRGPSSMTMEERLTPLSESVAIKLDRLDERMGGAANRPHYRLVA